MKNEGFTLMELLVYIGLVSILVVGIISFLVWMVKAGAQVKVQRETLYNARRTLDVVTRNIRNAKTASVFDSRLELENGTRTEFYLCGTSSTVVCKDEGETTTELTSGHVNADQLNFKRINTASTSPASISINLKLSYDNPGGHSWYESSVNLNSVVNLRSY